MNSFGRKIHKGILSAFVGVLFVLCVMIFAACDSDVKLIKIELVEGTYETQYEVGQTPTLIGAELKLTFDNGEVDFVKVTEEMAEVYDASRNLVFAYEFDIALDDEGNGTVVTKQELIAKYQDFIVQAAVDIVTVDYIEITSDGAIKKYTGSTPLEVLIIPETITANNGQTITITKISSGTAIGAFRNAQIAGIVLPPTLQYIDRNSFSGCENLRSVLFLTDKDGNSDFTAILAAAFKDCTRLESIDLPKSIATLSSNSFDGCTALRAITIQEGCINYFTPYGTSYEGAVYNFGQITFEDVAYSNAYIWPENKGYSTVEFIDRGVVVDAYSGPAGEIAPDILISRDHYAFDGWYCDNELTQELNKVIVQDENITVYAGWSPVKYTISYDLNGGENNHGNPVQYTIENEIELLDPIEREGYAFAGWSSFGIIEIGSWGNKTFIALWMPVSYSITYDLDGGENHIENLKTFTIETPMFQLLEPVKPGYVFGGWFSGDTSVTAVLSGTTGDILVSAKWKTDVYSILYIDGGSHQNPFAYTTEEGIILLDPVKQGYDFAGWYPGDTIAMGSTGNKEFTAVWTPTVYNIFYELNGGTNNEENPVYYTVESDTIELLIPSRDGYTFEKWASNPVIVKGSIGDKTFVAEWETIEFNIVYHLNGGINSIYNPANYTVEEAIILADPQRLGYNFSGWLPFSEILKGSTGEKTFTAIWSAISYKITYSLNGGINHSQNPESYTIEDNIVLYMPTRQGYDFTGWTPVDAIEKGSYGGKSFIANWKLIDYLITYDLGTNGVNNNRNPISYNFETATFDLSDPSRPGYEFTGWLEGNSVEKGSFGLLTFTAEWNTIEYVINYDLNGGENNTGNPEKYTIESAEINLYDPTRTGYYFDSWSNGGKIETGSIKEKSFAASWKNNVYSVRYESNGGVGTMPLTDSVTYDNPAKSILTENAFTRIGYTFKGWAQTAEAVISNYSDKADLSKYVALHDETIVLYAVWEANTYMITYKSTGDGGASMSSTEYVYDSYLKRNQTLSENTYYKNGNDFIGWENENGVLYNDAALINNEIISPYGVLKDITLATKWNPTTYALSLSYGHTSEDKSDFDNIESVSENVTYESPYSLPVPTRKGYTFEGWYMDSALKIQLTYGYKDFKQNSALVIGQGISIWNHYNISVTGTSVYAKWEIITYKINLNSTGGNVITFNFNRGETEDNIKSLAAPAIDFGYIFKQIELDGGKQIANRSDTAKASAFSSISAGMYIDVKKNTLEELTSISDGGILEISATVSTYGNVHEFGNGTTYESDNGIGILDFSKSNIDTPTVLNIEKSVKQITLRYVAENNPDKDQSKVFGNFRIEIAERSEPLTICFQDFRFKARDNAIAIQASSSFDLTIKYWGLNSFAGGNGTNGTDGAAVSPKTGEGTKGSTGTHNAGGAYKGEAALAGGIGGPGGPGTVGNDGKAGTNGTDGKVALKVIIAPTFIREDLSSTLDIVGGDGGMGGSGSKGGKGQQGGQGGTGGNGASSFHFYLLAAFTLYGKGGQGGPGGMGGQGGPGGAAGNGGNSASAIEYVSGIKPAGGNGLTLNSGTAGKAGNRGARGDGGDAGLQGIGGNGGNGNGWNVVGGLTGGIAGLIVEGIRSGGNGAGDLGEPGKVGGQGELGATGSAGVKPAPVEQV